MFRLLIIDDTKCKIELNDFLEKHKAAVIASLSPKHLDFNWKKRVLLKTATGIIVISVDEIMYCEIKNKDSLLIHTTHGDSINAINTVQLMEELLSRSFFARIHRSFLINLNHLEIFHKKPCHVILTNGIRLPASSRRKDYLIKKLNEIQ